MKTAVPNERPHRKIPKKYQSIDFNFLPNNTLFSKFYKEFSTSPTAITSSNQLDFNDLPELVKQISKIPHTLP